MNQFSFFFRQIVIFITITKTNVLFISKSYPHYSHLSLLIMWITFRKSFIFPHFFDFSMLISWKLLFFIFLHVQTLENQAVMGVCLSRIYGIPCAKPVFDFVFSQVPIDIQKSLTIFLKEGYWEKHLRKIRNSNRKK